MQFETTQRIQEAFNEEQAKAIILAVEAEERKNLQTLATKVDLQEVRAELKEFRAELKGDIASLQLNIAKWGIGIFLAQAALMVTLKLF